MANFKAEYLRYMDQKGIKYIDGDERAVRIRYTGDNIQTIEIVVAFDQKDDGHVALRSWSLGRIKEDVFAKVLLACNELNSKFRWVKFYVDKDMDVTAELDAIVDIDTVGQECAELVSRMVDICDEAYIDIMRVKLNL